ncbi:hypothetical protein GCM10007898_43610 [Dyella flagellata]|uniref:Uncharacterized protein n=1 Tax=Dyella flagellata TaxID=1867833 RepID=A0ABQ5XGG3_9GAMM|nr:hypothetical protein GCM10007898_43610 [Dyella flagellata]
MATSSACSQDWGHMKRVVLITAAVLTSLAVPILTLDYFLISVGDHLAALITTSMAAATAWLCLRSLLGDSHAEIRPWVLHPQQQHRSRPPAMPTIQPRR